MVRLLLIIMTLTESLAASTSDNYSTSYKGDVQSDGFILTLLNSTKNGSGQHDNEDRYSDVLKDVRIRSDGNQVDESDDDFNSSLKGRNSLAENLPINIEAIFISKSDKIGIQKQINNVMKNTSKEAILKENDVTSHVTDKLSNRIKRSVRCSPIGQRQLCPWRYERRLENSWKRSLQEAVCGQDRVTAITGSLIECVPKYASRRVQLRQCNGTRTCYDNVTIGVGCIAVLPCVIA